MVILSNIYIIIAMRNLCNGIWWCKKGRRQTKENRTKCCGPMHLILHKNIQYDRFECEWIQSVAIKEWCYCCFHRKMPFRLKIIMIIIIIRSKAALIERKLVLFYRNHLHLPMSRILPSMEWMLKAFSKQKMEKICLKKRVLKRLKRNALNQYDFTSAFENSMTYKNFICK